MFLHHDYLMRATLFEGSKDCQEHDKTITTSSSKEDLLPTWDIYDDASIADKNHIIIYIRIVCLR